VEVQSEPMEKQAKECSKKLLKLRKQLMKGSNLSKGSTEAAAVLLHEAADMLIMMV
jgi:hypothetical protein